MTHACPICQRPDAISFGTDEDEVGPWYVIDQACDCDLTPEQLDAVASLAWANAVRAAGTVNPEDLEDLPF